jgi:hypothetical protein
MEEAEQEQATNKRAKRGPAAGEQEQQQPRRRPALRISTSGLGAVDERAEAIGRSTGSSSSGEGWALPLSLPPTPRTPPGLCAVGAGGGAGGALPTTKPEPVPAPKQPGLLLLPIHTQGAGEALGYEYYCGGLVWGESKGCTIEEEEEVGAWLADLATDLGMDAFEEELAAATDGAFVAF